MTVIYLIRHAQAIGNVENRVNGITDCDLTEDGYAQTEKLAQAAPAFGVDIVYASPLIRAYKTAEAFNRFIAKPLVTDERLREVNAGKWDGMKWDDIEGASQLYELYTKDKDAFIHGGGEPFELVFARMAAAVTEIARENEGKTVAVVSHGAAIRCFMCCIKGIPPELYPTQPPLKNTGITKVIYDRETNAFTIVHENDTSHLKSRETL
jgi:broad specificity phosphatase PhoE